MAAVITSQWVIDKGRALGFARVGIAPAADLPELARFPEWLARGYAGRMDYLRDSRRADVRHVMPEARAVICCALPYDTPHPRSTEVPPEAERGWISRYAWGEDYHRIVEQKLEALRAALAQEAGEGFQTKLYVDTGPVLERVYAQYAGLGWQAKNTCLLDEELGSFFFLGLLVTNLELAPDAPLADGCGACTLCLEACPTGALVEPYVLDARRCLSYLTIELRDAIPKELRAPLGRHVFGCDICQDVCPYNRRAQMTDLPAFQPRTVETRPQQDENRKPKSENRSQPPSPRACPEQSRRAPAPGSPEERAQTNIPEPRGSFTPSAAEARLGESLFHPRLRWLANLSEEDFRRLFRGSAVKRAKWRGLLRNTLVAMGNSGHACFRPTLERFAASDDLLLAEHAQWALQRLEASG